jgi:hypothetical protein
VYELPRNRTLRLSLNSTSIKVMDFFLLIASKYIIFCGSILSLGEPAGVVVVLFVVVTVVTVVDIALLVVALVGSDPVDPALPPLVVGDSIVDAELSIIQGVPLVLERFHEAISQEPLGL